MINPVVTSLTIALPRKELLHGKEYFTGIMKQPAAGPIRLSVRGFEGDGVGDTKHHGGSDKAVCVYIHEHYRYWETTLKTALPTAAFGENVTLSGITEAGVAIGDVFRLGTALVQVSQPRQPCNTLAARFGRSDMVKLVVDAGKTGFYLRVLEEGVVQQGDAFSLMERDSRSVTVAFANQVYHHDRKDREGIEQVLAVPALAASWRESFEKLRGQMA